MPNKSGKSERPPPKRGEPLKIDLPFEDAIKAALETEATPKPPATSKKKRKAD